MYLTFPPLLSDNTALKAAMNAIVREKVSRG
jgi:hypothetical protein